MKRIALAMILLIACGEGANLRVDLRTDLTPELEVHEVVVVLDDEVEVRTIVNLDDNLLSGAVVGRFDGLEPGTHRLSVRLLDVRTFELGRRELRLDVSGATVSTVVFTRSCLSVLCPDPEAPSCVNGRCVAPECSPETPDACADSLCSDLSMCPASTVDCAVAACVDGLCLQQPVDGACGSEQICVPGDGCNDRPGADAGRDGGTDASTCEEGAECETGNTCERGIVDCVSGEPQCVSAGVQDAGVVCRAATSECDVEEQCDGVASICPPDESVETGAVCDGGFCNDGICGECQPGANCSTGNPCQLGRIRCTDDGTPECEADAFAPNDTVCRPPMGDCDTAETCTGTSAACPADEVLGPSTTCRGAAGECDRAETCDGVGATCPANSFRPGSFECRASRGECDLAETCTGSSPTCPGDTRRAAGAVCRAGGTCDPPELCTGSADTCPANEFTSVGTSCGASDVCNGMGMCVDLGCGEPCSTGNACEIGVTSCTTGAPVCVRASFRPSSFVCRPSMGPCDVQETCTGSTAACPANGFVGGGTQCRASAGVCDVAESCTGSSAACPTNGFASSSVRCRSSAGECDVSEFCTGGSARCPANRFAPSSTVCRAAAGICDATERCTGSSSTCPADGNLGVGAACGECGLCTATGMCPFAMCGAGQICVCRGQCGSMMDECR